ncbi:MAG TPA: hypothetical protein VMM58_13780 [Bacteroidota bacterium]|nr:hypothetical protein [Bacteroidota bacterium]
MQPKPDRFIPALYGGLIIAGISAIPGLNLINVCCCAGILLGGFLAVFFYNQEMTAEMDPLTSNDCVRLGALAGVIAAVAGTVISMLVMLVFGNIAIEMMMRIIHRMNIELPPNIDEMINQGMEEKISFFGMVFSLFLNLIIDIIFSTLGGLIGWSVFKPKPQYPQQPG